MFLVAIFGALGCGGWGARAKRFFADARGRKLAWLSGVAKKFLIWSVAEWLVKKAGDINKKEAFIPMKHSSHELRLLMSHIDEELLRVAAVSKQFTPQNVQIRSCKNHFVDAILQMQKYKSKCPAERK